MQNGHHTRRGCAYRSPSDEILPGVLWGRPEWVPSPAYWVALHERSSPELTLFAEPTSLAAEVVFCLLGGYGISAEMNCAAFSHLEEHGVLTGDAPSEEYLAALLMVPLILPAGPARYRFPHQRARRLSLALERIISAAPWVDDALELRTFLMTFEGIGPKTASWIVRNWLRSDEVAIIDIHVERACRVMGLIDSRLSVATHYFEIERKFLAFAQAIDIPAGTLDAIMWSEMRKLGTLVLDQGAGQEERDGQWRRRRRGQPRHGVAQTEAIKAAA